MINADIKEIIIPSNIFNDSFFLFALCNIFTILYKFKFIVIKLAGGERFVKTVCGRQVHRG